MSGQEDKKTFGISKLQALFRGKVAREGEYKRAKAGADILCPFLASPPSVVAAILQLSNGQLGKDSLFYDLGCGDGQILTGVAAATGDNNIGVSGAAPDANLAGLLLQRDSAWLLVLLLLLCVGRACE